jgi:hypothetical protein
MKGWKLRKFAGDVVYDLRSRRLLPIAIALAAAVVLVPAYFALTGSDNGGGNDNGGGSSDDFPEEAGVPEGVAAFSEMYVTDEAHDAIEECGYTDTQEQRRLLLQSPPGPNGRITVSRYDTNGDFQGTLQMRQTEQGIYLMTCTPAD